uniref:Generative cell specific-1/HAP2 domain-containing protein n=1 Tax=Amphimedon queenslandica TaxID=400682 RepID=A0A1X7UMY0_AMPQE
MTAIAFYFILFSSLYPFHSYWSVSASLVSSSEIQFCQRQSASYDPILSNGEACSKKFLVALAVRNGQGESGSIYADIKHVNNRTRSGSTLKREQLRKPIRITVTKSDVLIRYPLRYIGSVNNQPAEYYLSITNHFLGIDYCGKKPRCSSHGGYCCWATRDEKLSRAWEYKRGVGSKVGHYHSHRYSQAICITYDSLNYNVFEVLQPYITYTINVTVQELDYKREIFGRGGGTEDVWRTIGYAEIGPDRIGQNTNQNQVGKSSGTNIKAVWLGDFKLNSYIANFNSKYILTPDWRAASNPQTLREHAQVRNGASEWLVVDRHLVDMSGRTCNKIGTRAPAFIAQTNRCFQEQNSCFKVTPSIIYAEAKAYKNRDVPTHYFPPFYGDFLGPYSSDEERLSDDTGLRDFQLVYRSTDIHKSLITLTFTAEAISFVENRSTGRIVEALVNDFVALIESGILTVVIQNTGAVTADYSVSINQCTDGIIRVSERIKTVDPRQQVTFEFELSSSLNVAFNHSCIIELTDKDGSLLDVRDIKFRTDEGCIYCPAGVCSCDCEIAPTSTETESTDDCSNEQYLNPYWTPEIIVIEPCYHCWFTDPLTHPVYATFIAVVLLLCLGMGKLLITNWLCRTKDGRPIDVVGIMLGTASIEHTRRKQRSVTIQFLLGACFFVYLPLLPLMIIFCNWRRRLIAKKRLKKKADRKRKRLLKRKQAALEATKGLMVLGENDNITMTDAMKAMEKLGKGPAKLVVSSSSDSEKEYFEYSSSSDLYSKLSHLYGPT